MTATLRTTVTALVIGLSMFASACSSTTSSTAATPAATVGSGAQSTSSSTATISSTTPPATAAPTTLAAAGKCVGPATIPTGQKQFGQVTGDLDADGKPDTATAWQDDNGVSHVFVALGNGRTSDVGLASGYNAVNTNLTMEDYFYDGTDAPRALVIVAISKYDTASGGGEFLQIYPGTGCIAEWGDASEPFTFYIDAQNGLTCDGGKPAGPASYMTVQSVAKASGGFTVTETAIGLNNFNVTRTVVMTTDVADSTGLGDVQTCLQPKILG